MRFDFSCAISARVEASPTKNTTNPISTNMKTLMMISFPNMKNAFIDKLGWVGLNYTNIFATCLVSVCGFSVAHLMTMLLRLLFEQMELNHIKQKNLFIPRIGC